MKIIKAEQGSAEWLDARKGVVTGTSLKTVMGTTSKDFIYELVAQQVSPLSQMYVSEAMENGAKNEPVAIERYETQTGILTSQVPFCLHDQRHWHGLSPDRLAQEKKKYVGGVEVKCPTPKVHIKYLVQNRIPAEYKWQVVNYFLVNDEQKWLDFVSFCPDIEIPRLQLHIIRVTREELQDDIAKAEEKLEAFRKQWAEIENKLLF